MKLFKNRMVILCASLLMLLPLYVGSAFAADQPAAAEQMEKAPAAQVESKHMKSGDMTKQTAMVTGTIVANKNKAGKIVSYSLAEDGGHSYMLSKHGKGNALRKMVGQKIEATGTLQEAKGRQWITVKEFKAIK